MLIKLALVSQPAKMVLNHIIKKNNATLKIYNDCDNLPAWRFFKILDTGELRYLLKTDTLPEYFEHLLDPVWDDILNQYDRLNGEYTFQNSVADLKEDIIKTNEYIIFKASYDLMSLGDERALKILSDEFGIEIESITVESLKKVRSKLVQFQTQLQIERLSRSEEKKKGEEVEENSFIRAIIQMSGILKRNLDKDKVTVTEWIYLNKECSDIIKIHKENGRRNTIK